MIEELIRRWDGLAVVTSFDPVTGAWTFIGMHDDTLGPCVGGTRLKVYDAPSDGLRDALRLSEGMTNKWAAIDIPYGGGKGVIALPRPLTSEEREPLLQRYGRLVGSLRGSFRTGQDLGTTTDDMVTIARETEFIHGIDRGSWTAIDPGPFTARGVFVGTRAAVKAAFGGDTLAGRSVLIQGAGDVGEPLARLLAGAGARLLVSDLDAERAGRVAEAVGGTVVDPDAVYATPCDVYAPCAVGATVNSDTIAQLQCRIVAGSANNQLAVPEDAERLHERGVLYAPDYVINGGGATAFGLLAQGVDDEDELYTRVELIGPRLHGMFAEAASRDESPVHSACRTVNRALGRG